MICIYQVPVHLQPNYGRVDITGKTETTEFVNQINTFTKGINQLFDLLLLETLTYIAAITI